MTTALPQGDAWAALDNPNGDAPEHITICSNGDILFLADNNNLYLRTGVTDTLP